MASENTKRLYAHYLTVPTKAKQAAELLKRFPELKQNDKKETAGKKEEVVLDGTKSKR